jgi:predicted ABC-type ATPase
MDAVAAFEFGRGAAFAGDADWKESDHPRGQPGNAGQFGAGGGSKSEKKASKVPSRGDQVKAAGGVADFLRMAGGSGGKIQEFVLKNGQPYTVNDKTYAGPRKPMHQCFKNAAEDAMEHRDRTYVEGYITVHGVPIDHAWTVDDKGQVYDPTIHPNENVGGYFGVPFNTDYLTKSLVENEHYGLFGYMSQKTLGPLMSGEEKSFKQPVDPNKLPPDVVADRLAFAEAESKKIPDTSKIDTPERKALRKKIADDLYNKDIDKRKREKKVTLVLGLPASGKSSLAGPIVEADGALELDPDMVKERLPEYQNGLGAFATHEESSEVARGLMARALESGDNIVWPRVDSPDKVIRDIKNLKSLGYSVHVKHLEVKPEVAERSAVDRFFKSGRYVSPMVVREYGNRPRESYDAVKKSGLADSTEMYERGYGAGKHSELKKVE